MAIAPKAKEDKTTPKQCNVKFRSNLLCYKNRVFGTILKTYKTITDLLQKHRFRKYRLHKSIIVDLWNQILFHHFLHSLYLSLRYVFVDRIYEII